MYLLEAPDETIPAFKEVWAGIGDSIVVVGGDGLWNCHIHTDDVGAAIEAALDAGRPREIRVTDLAEQVEEERWVREGAGDGRAAADGAAVRRRSPRSWPWPAATASDGSSAPSASSHLVAGGQSMNPSTADLVEAVEATPVRARSSSCRTTRTSVPVADQVDELSAKRVWVVPTRAIAEGFAALLDYDPDAGADANAAAMEAGGHRVVAGEVTRAVRDTTTDAGRVAGRRLASGCRATAIEAVGDEPVAGAASGCSTTLVEPEHELVTLIEGEGSPPADTRRITEWLRDEHPGGRGRGPPRRPAALPVPFASSEPERPSGRRARPARQTLAVSELRSGRVRQASAALAVDGDRLGPRPAHRLPAPLHRPDQRRPIHELVRRRRGASSRRPCSR